MRTCFLLTLLMLVLPALGKDYQVQALESAHASFRSATNSAGYAEAAQQYETLIHEEGIRNGHLFYTAGNSWFMAGRVGRAILNYRRAGQYLPNDADLQHNLEAALELRTDLIPEKERHPLSARLLGWHFNTSTRTRWVLFATLWMICWVLLIVRNRFARKELRAGAAVTGLFSAILLVSLVAESIANHRANPGVITAAETVARKGDGTMYAPAFLDPLHAGTEFQTLEIRGKWMHIQLPDGQACWIPAEAAETVNLRD